MMQQNDARYLPQKLNQGYRTSRRTKQHNINITYRQIITLLLPIRHISFSYLCVGVVYVVLLGSPTGSITLVSHLREIQITTLLLPRAYFLQS